MKFLNHPTFHSFWICPIFQPVRPEIFTKRVFEWSSRGACLMGIRSTISVHATALFFVFCFFPPGESLQLSWDSQNSLKLQKVYESLLWIFGLWGSETLYVCFNDWDTVFYVKENKGVVEKNSLEGIITFPDLHFLSWIINHEVTLHLMLWKLSLW